MTRLTPIRRGSLVDTAIESLRNAIQTSQWNVGERLPVEAELSEALGVSRNTVREAVRVLAHVGMLETRQGDGTYVRSTRDPGEALRRASRSRLRDQLEVRVMLEAEAAGLAAARRTRDDLDEMTRALDERAAAGSDLELRIRHDERFHHALVEAAHNPALLEMYRYFAQSITDTIQRTEQDADLPEPSQEDHELLLAAIRQQNRERSIALARGLLQPSLTALDEAAQ
ncbi:transcriptional regulator, GntR family [Marinobacter daqiaonensis]|uniref:Transcriptional regulator, GntR family n=1 Tax=Marinobacter daqiaonensis TaxID=650891 RepID=A0A1I6GPX6_9GAMM|nr:FCD domain-containing protein [Marinobacter daqiaonensis]SFR44161.1 transcriptional regulator, GntR family [Marinobacter daqiaonensis]